MGHRAYACKDASSSNAQRSPICARIVALCPCIALWRHLGILPIPSYIDLPVPARNTLLAPSNDAQKAKTE